jgi:hypothetical protein
LLSNREDEIGVGSDSFSASIGDLSADHSAVLIASTTASSARIFAAA